MDNGHDKKRDVTHASEMKHKTVDVTQPADIKQQRWNTKQQI